MSCILTSGGNVVFLLNPKPERLDEALCKYSVNCCKMFIKILWNYYKHIHYYCTKVCLFYYGE